jgi:hypothetical protein
METKTQRIARLKAMRKKYGLGEFKKQKSIKRSRTYNFMAKRRSVKRRSSRSSGTGNIWSNVLGVGGYIAFESFLEPMIPIQNPNTLDIAEIALGLWLSKKGGVVGNVGKTAVILNTYSLIKRNLSLGGLVQNSTF